MNIKGAQRILDNNKSLEIDESSNRSIKTENLRNKLIKIYKMIKNLKK